MNLGTNKTLINVNGKVANINTNENARITYNVKDPIMLNIGDRVTLYQAFLNEAGLNQDTISFEEDMSATMKFLYYTQSNNEAPLANKPVSGLDKPGEAVKRNCEYQEYTNYPCQQDLQLSTDPVTVPIASVRKNMLVNTMGKWDKRDTGDNYGFTDNYSGANGQIMYAMANHNISYSNVEVVSKGRYEEAYDGDGFIEPIYGEVTINIPAGNYGVDAVSQLITEQLVGGRIAGKNFVVDRFYSGEGDGLGTVIDTTVTDIPGVPISNQRIFETENSCMTELMMPTNCFGRMEEWGKAVTGAKPSDTTELKLEIPLRVRSGDFFGVLDNCFNPTRREGFLPDINLPKTASARDPNAFSSTATFVRGDFFINAQALEAWSRSVGTGNIAINYKDIISLGMNFDGTKPNQRDKGDPFPSDGVGEVATVPLSRSQLLLNSAQYVTLPRPYFTVAGSSFGECTPRRYCGTSAINIQYSSSKANRFSLNNLHEPNKMPTVAGDGSNSSFSGQQCSSYNTYRIEGWTGGTDASGDLESDFNVRPVFQPYPVEAKSGIMVSNFDESLVKDTVIYKTLKKNYESFLSLYGRTDPRTINAKYLWKTQTYDGFFEGTVEGSAERAWDKGLWARLGFSYAQMGDINNIVEKVYVFNDHENKISAAGGNVVVPLKGIITHNATDYTDIISSGNLGSETVQGGGAKTLSNINTYSGISFNQGGGNTVNTELYIQGGSQFTLLCQSQPLDADKLPNLNNGNSYYLIHSDIVKTNYLDAKGDKGTIVGVMTKQMSSNDTVYSTSGIEFVCTEQKLLTQINLEVTNPDGTIVPDALLGENSGFIFMIDRPIRPPDMEVINF